MCPCPLFAAARRTDGASERTSGGKWRVGRAFMLHGGCEVPDTQRFVESGRSSLALAKPKKAIHLPVCAEAHNPLSMIRVLRGRKTLTTSSAARLLSTAGHMPRQARSLPLTSLWNVSVQLLRHACPPPLRAADHGEALCQGRDQVPGDSLAVRSALVRDHATVLCQGRRVAARVRLSP